MHNMRPPNSNVFPEVNEMGVYASTVWVLSFKFLISVDLSKDLLRNTGKRTGILVY